MKTEQLLNDIFAEAEPAQFRDALLAETLRHVRHRRRVRHTTRAAWLALVALVSLFWLWTARKSAPPFAARTTQANPGIRIVTSAPLASALVISSRADSIIQISSRPATVQIVSTADSPPACQEIGDDELLHFFAGRPVALVGGGAQPAELLLLPIAE